MATTESVTASPELTLAGFAVTDVIDGGVQTAAGSTVTAGLKPMLPQVFVTRAQ